MKHYKKAFTLVELIVVVTILAILSTVGFVAFSGYLEGVRDINRISQMKNIHDGIITYQTENQLPMPDDYIEVKMGTEVIGYQGYAGDNILSKIEFSTEGIDPKEKMYFTYATTSNKKYFALMGFLEEENGLESITFGNSAVAANYTNRYPIVTGKKVGILLDDSNNPVQENTLIQSAGFIDITSLSDVYQLYLSDDEIYSGTGSALLNKSINYDCKRLLDMKGGLQDGIYGIDPDGNGETTNVYCDMTTDGGGWTYTTMLADTGTENIFEENAIDNPNHADFITSTKNDIDTRGKLTNIWTNDSNRDILLQCFSDEVEHLKYEEPFIIYNFSGIEKSNLTDKAKAGNAFSSESLDAKWKNKKFTLNTEYRSGSANDMRIQDTLGNAVFLLNDTQLVTEDILATFDVNINSPAFDSVSKYTNLSGTTYCISAIR